VAAINGFDSFGHYLRAGLIVNQCANYAVEPTFGCSANFQANAGSSSARAASSGARRDPVLRRTAIALARALGLPVPRGGEPRKARKQSKPKRTRTAAPKPVPTPAPTATPTPQPAPPAGDEKSQTETLLDYLFGGDE
jgi:hypothetical protein